MCGIIGVLGKSDVVASLIDALKRLEYRGYDSAGVATLASGKLERRRAEGKIRNLEARLTQEPLTGRIGIGHTRWATHGEANENNAHPHATDRVALVHNGIIENYQELRQELTQQGCRFATETDSEVVAHLISVHLKAGQTPAQAVQAAVARLRGAYALAIMIVGDETRLYGVRSGSPLVVGWGDGEMYLGSDALALASLTQKISYLEEGDWVELTHGGARFFDKTNSPVDRAVKLSALSGALTGKGNFPHFMLKEIYDQPTVIGECLNALFNPATREIALPQMPFDLAKITKLTIVACGTSYYAGMVAKYWFEKIARINVDVDIASEFRYRETPMTLGGAALFISQSGETIDTLAALRFAKENGQHTLALVNVQESAMAREADFAMMLHAGPEIGVASTKAFTCQLVSLAALAIATARARGAINAGTEAELSGAIAEVPSRVSEILGFDDAIRDLAKKVVDARDIVYVGRGTSYPIALEGALKLKELSYIHAEGFAAGELKHGPIALIDPSVPVIVIAPSDDLFEKTASALQQVASRGAQVILITDAKGANKIGHEARHHLALPNVHPFVAPILFAIPVQLLAYHVAVLKGTDVDQPRNLAKSVTVE